MAVDSQGPKGEPQFAENAPINDAIEKSALGSYAALVGNRKAGYASDRTVQTAPNVWEGLEWFEVDTGKTYLWTGNAWHLNRTLNRTFTPTFTSGVTVGNGSSYGNYTIENGVVIDLVFAFLLGSTSAITGSVGLQIPDGFSLNTVTGAFRFPIGEAVLYDNSAGAEVYGEITIGSSTSAAIRARNASGTYQTAASLSPTAPFTWATGDQISGHIRAQIV